MVEKFDRAVEGILLPLVCLVGVLGAVIINNSIIKTHFNTLWFRNSYKCKEIERNAGKCKEIQRNVEKCREMQRKYIGSIAPNLKILKKWLPDLY